VVAAAVSSTLFPLRRWRWHGPVRAPERGLRARRRGTRCATFGRGCGMDISKHRVRTYRTLHRFVRRYCSSWNCSSSLRFQLLSNTSSQESGQETGIRKIQLHFNQAHKLFNQFVPMAMSKGIALRWYWEVLLFYPWKHFSCSQYTGRIKTKRVLTFRVINYQIILNFDIFLCNGIERINPLLF
jgi:hypothetical protein